MPQVELNKLSTANVKLVSPTVQRTLPVTEVALCDSV